jgi:hypothetical protein
MQLPAYKTHHRGNTRICDQKPWSPHYQPPSPFHIRAGHIPAFYLFMYFVGTNHSSIFTRSALKVGPKCTTAVNFPLTGPATVRPRTRITKFPHLIPDSPTSRLLAPRAHSQDRALDIPTCAGSRLSQFHHMFLSRAAPGPGPNQSRLEAFRRLFSGAVGAWIPRVALITVSR